MTIGSKVIIAAGSVVTHDIPDNSVAAGVPARVIRSLDDHVAIIEARTRAYPWYPLIEARGKTTDPSELRKIEQDPSSQRRAYFYPTDIPPAP